MRAPGASTKAVQECEREIRELQRMMDERDYEPEHLPSREAPELQQNTRSKQQHNKNGKNESEPHTRAPPPPLNNEREARLRQRMLERLAKSKKGQSQETPSRKIGSMSQQRPATANVGMAQRKSQLYVEQAAAAHNNNHSKDKDEDKDKERGWSGNGNNSAWGEHGMGLPFLAKEKKEEREEKEVDGRAERERRLKEVEEQRARKVREAKVLQEQMRGEEGAGGRRGSGAGRREGENRHDNDNIVVQDPFIDISGLDINGVKGTSTKDAPRPAPKPSRRDDPGDETDSGEEEEPTESPPSPPTNSRMSARKAEMFEGSPDRRRIFDRGRPLNVQAKQEPRQTGKHNLFKVYDKAGGSGALDSHREVGRRQKEGLQGLGLGGGARPSTVGPGVTRAKGSNFLAWSGE
jgi:hypothetical protein